MRRTVLTSKLLSSTGTKNEGNGLLCSSEADEEELEELVELEELEELECRRFFGERSLEEEEDEDDLRLPELEIEEDAGLEEELEELVELEEEEELEEAFLGFGEHLFGERERPRFWGAALSCFCSFGLGLTFSFCFGLGRTSAKGNEDLAFAFVAFLIGFALSALLIALGAVGDGCGDALPLGAASRKRAGG